MHLQLGRHEINLVHVVGVVLLLALVAVGIVVMVMLPGRSADTLDTVARVGSGNPAEFAWITPERLIVPDESASARQMQWVPHRPRRERWTDADVLEHWLDPAEIGLEVLDERVETYIRRLCEEVP